MSQHCATSSLNYLPLFKKLLQSDPRKYVSFNEAGRYLLSRNIDPAARALAIYHFAELYNSMAALKKSTYNAGVAAGVLELQKHLGDPTDFIAQAGELLKAKPAKYKVLSGFDTAIKALAATPIQRVHDAVVTILDRVKFLPDSESQNEVRRRLVDRVRALEGYIPNARFILDHLIKIETAAYVPLSSLGIRATHLIRFADGSAVDGIVVSDREIYRFGTEGEQIPVAPKLVADYTPITGEMQERGVSNHGELIIHDDALSSGFAIYAEALGQKGMNAFKDNIPGMNTVTRIIAVPVTTGIRPEVAAIPGRRHETFETPAQETRLQQGLPALTRSRVTAEHGFQLMGENPDGSRFILSAPDTYTLIYPDNRTSSFNPADPRHLELLPQTAVVGKMFGKTEEMNPEHIADFVASATRYQDFAKTVRERLRKGKDDVTDLFFGNYTFSAKPGGHTIQTFLRPLPEYLADPKYAGMVSSFEVETTVEGARATVQRAVPLIVYRESQSAVFKFVQTLAPGEAILYNGKRYANPGALWREVHGAASADSTLTGGKPNFHLLDFRSGKNQPLYPKDSGSEASLIKTSASVLYSLNRMIERSWASQDEVNSVMFDFRREVASFDDYKGLVARFAIRLKDGVPSLIYEIVPTKDSTFTPFFTDPETGTPVEEIRKAFSHTLDVSDMFPDPAVTEKLAAQYGLSEKYNLGKAGDVGLLYAELTAIHEADSADAELGKVLKDIRTNYTTLGERIGGATRRMLSTLRKSGAQGEALAAEIDKTYVGKSGSTFDFLSTRRDPANSDKLVPGLRDMRRDYAELSNYRIYGARPSAKWVKVVPSVPVAAAKKTVKPVPERNTEMDTLEPVGGQPLSPSNIEDPTAANVSMEEPVTTAGETPSPKKPTAKPRGARRSGPTLFRLEEDGAADTASLSVATDWITRDLPQIDVRFASLGSRLANARVMGLFFQDSITLDDRLADGGTLYHEAFHAVFRTLMTPAEREALLVGGKAFGAAAISRFRKLRGLHHLSARDVQKRMREEDLAEGFRRFMTGKTEPQSMIDKLYSLLKKLMDFIRGRKRPIEKLYSDIAQGAYRERTLIPDEGNVAYQLLQTRDRVHFDIESRAEEGEKPVRIYSGYLSTAAQRELVYRMANMMLRTPEGKFSKKRFDLVRKELYTNTYRIDNLVAQNPEKAKEIEDAYGDTYRDIRYVLGERLDNENADDLVAVDYTGDEAPWFARAMEAEDEEGNITEAEDTDGMRATLAQLESAVRRLTDSVAVSNQAQSMSLTEDDRFFDAYGETEEQEEDREGEERDGDSGQYDRQFWAQKKLKFNKGFRRFFTLIPYERYDSSLGLNLPSMIDGEYVYSLILKIASDVMPDDILGAVRTAQQSFEMDGKTNEARVLKTVLNSLDELMGDVGIDGLPKNEQLYRQFIDTMHNTETPNVKIRIESDIEYDDAIGESILVPKSKAVDVIMDTDARDTHTRLISEWQTRASERNSASDPLERGVYAQGAEELLETLSEMNLKKDVLLPSEEAAVGYVNDLADRITDGLSRVGLYLDKSLIRYSLIASKRFRIGEGRTSRLPESFESVMRSNAMFTARRNYLKADFFEELKKLITKGLKTDKAGGLTLNFSSETIEDSLVINASLRNIAPYLVRYDMSKLPTVFRNANGDPQYRHTAYTSTHLIAQSIRQRGLKAGIRQRDTKIYDEYLNDWFADNPFAASTPELEAFASSFSVSMLGGVEHRVNGFAKNEATFKDMDPRSVLLADILHFTNQQTELYGEGDAQQEMRVFNRNLSTLEAASTAFLVPAVYTKTVTQKGKLTERAGLPVAVSYFADSVKQEYNRIQREWQGMDERIARFRAGDNTLLDAYNFKKVKGQPVYKDEEGQPLGELRAFRFGLPLANFFSSRNPENSEARGIIADKLRQAALAGVSWTQLSPALVSEMNDQLSSYAEEQFAAQLEELARQDIVRIGKDGKVSSDFFGQVVKVNGRPAKSESGDEGYRSLRDMLYDWYFNNRVNALFVNQFLGADTAMGIKDAADLFKRNRSFLAAGSTMKDTFYRAAVVDKMVVYMHPGQLEGGQYDSPEAARKELSARVNVHAAKEKFSKDRWESEMSAVDAFVEALEPHDVFDGQSVSTLFHRMDQWNSTGRLSRQAIDTLMRMQYTRISEPELDALHEEQISPGSGKTVTANGLIYHKLSEHSWLRVDNSLPVLLPGETRQDWEARIDGLYRQAWSLRRGIQDHMRLSRLADVDPFDAHTESEEGRLASIYGQIHTMWAPKKGREIQYNIMNSMELAGIDQLMDKNASKMITFFTEGVSIDGGIDTGALRRASQWVDGNYKFHQVETSGIKDQTKNSIQPALIISGDVRSLLDTTEIPAGEREALDEALNEYYRYLSHISGAAKQTHVTLYNDENGALRLDLLFDSIRKGLEAQGADQHLLSLFETVSGKIQFSPEMPELRRSLKYNMFAKHSREAGHDVRQSGRKDFHVSSLGYKLIEDLETGRIVTQKEYELDPDLYDSERYITRYPGVVSETDSQGVKRHYVEVLIPAPFFANEEDEKFWWANQNTMFSTRIPTESKSSMVAARVVDFIDSAYGNSIVVPQLVHSLSGSDLDIDTLYSHTYATYRDLGGAPHKYGERTTAVGRFAEYLLYAESSSPLSSDISEEVIRIRGEELILDKRIIKIGAEMGVSDGLFSAIPVLQSNLADAKSRRAEYFAQWTSEKEKGDALVEEGARADRSLQSTLRNSWEELDEEIAEMKKSFSTARRAYLRVLGTLNVLSRRGLPSTSDMLETFATKYGTPVLPASQNRSLDKKIQILSSDSIFAKAYIRNAASTAMFDEFIRTLGVNAKQLFSQFNAFSPEGVINANRLNKGSKNGTAIVANLKKTFAFFEQYGLRLSNPQWYLTRTGDRGTAVNEWFTGFTSEGVRLVGEILGVIVDGGKDPKAAVVGMTDETLEVVCAMIAKGMPPGMAVYSLQLPEIKRSFARLALQNRKIEIETAYKPKIVDIFAEEVAANPELSPEKCWAELVEAGLAFKPEGKNYHKVEWRDVIIGYSNPENINFYAAGHSLTDVGITFASMHSKEPLPDHLAKFLFYQRYEGELKQVMQIKQLAKAVYALKSLTPEFGVVSDMLGAFSALSRESEELAVGDESAQLFESAGTVFKQNDDGTESVWTVLRDSLRILYQQGSETFAGVNPRFLNLKTIPGNDRYGLSDEAFASSLLSYVALRAYTARYKELATPVGEEESEMTADIAKVLKEMSEAKWWYGMGSSSMQEEYSYMNESYSDNAFVRHSFIRSERVVKGSNEGKARLQYLVSQDRSNLPAEIKEAVQDGYTQLARSADPRAHKFAAMVAHQELIRGGADGAGGMLASYINPLARKLYSHVLDGVKNTFYTAITEARALREDGFLSSDGRKSLVSALTQGFAELMGTEAIEGFVGEMFSDFQRNLLSVDRFSESVMKLRDINKRDVYTEEKFNTTREQMDALIAQAYPVGLEKTFIGYKFNGDTITVSTPQGVDKEQSRLVRSLLRAGGAMYNESAETSSFSPAITRRRSRQQAATVYILSSVDGVPVSQLYGEAFAELLAGTAKPDTVFSGKTATYTLVESAGAKAVSPLAFSAEQGRLISRVKLGKMDTEGSESPDMSIDDSVDIFNSMFDEMFASGSQDSQEDVNDDSSIADDDFLGDIRAAQMSAKELREGEQIKKDCGK